MVRLIFARRDPEIAIVALDMLSSAVDALPDLASVEELVSDKPVLVDDAVGC